MNLKHIVSVFFLEKIIKEYIDEKTEFSIVWHDRLSPLNRPANSNKKMVKL